MDEVEVEVVGILRELEIPVHFKGYQYIVTAVKYLLENPNAIHSLTKELYPEVSKVHGQDSKGHRIEKNIRTALTYNKADDVTWHRVLGRTLPMANGKFLSSLLEEVRIKQRFAEEARKE